MSEKAMESGTKNILIGVAAVAAAQAITIAIVHQFWSDFQAKYTESSAKGETAQAARDSAVERLGTLVEKAAPTIEQRVYARRIARHTFAKLAVEKEGLPDAARVALPMISALHAEGWTIAQVSPLPPEPAAEKPSGAVDVLFVLERALGPGEQPTLPAAQEPKAKTKAGPAPEKADAAEPPTDSDAAEATTAPEPDAAD